MHGAQISFKSYYIINDTSIIKISLSTAHLFLTKTFKLHCSKLKVAKVALIIAVLSDRGMICNAVHAMIES